MRRPHVGFVHRTVRYHSAVAAASSLVGKVAVLHTYPSDMAQNFWGAIWAWTSCFIVTIVVSLITRPRPSGELAGLVYSLTPRIADDRLVWYKRPAALGLVVSVLTVALNLLFW